jgi:hypothetical protein
MGRRFLGKQKVTWTLYPSTIQKVKALAEAREATISDVLEEVLNRVILKENPGLTGWEGFTGEPVRLMTEDEKKLFPHVFRAYMASDVTPLRAFDVFQEKRKAITSELQKHKLDAFTIADPYTITWCAYISANINVARVWAYTLHCMRNANKESTVTFSDWSNAFSKGIPERTEITKQYLEFLNTDRNWE